MQLSFGCGVICSPPPAKLQLLGAECRGRLRSPTVLNQRLQIWREKESYCTIFNAPRVSDVPSLCRIVPFRSKLLSRKVFLRIRNAQQGARALDKLSRGLRGFTFDGILLAFDFHFVVERAGEFGD